MLNVLDITNIALIDHITIEPKCGLSALTGETGAGKSIIIDSVNLILGARASKEFIRYGEDKAIVQAVFSVSDSVCEKLSEFGITAENNEIIISREITRDGKSSCRINGMLVTQNVLRDVAMLLVNIHGQQDNHSLLRCENHLKYLDDYAENQELQLAYKKDYLECYELEQRIKRLSQNEKERLERIDLLRYQTDEIAEANLTLGEKEDLEAELVLIENAERLTVATGEACELLYDGEETNAYELISRAADKLSQISEVESVSELSERLYDIKYNLEDIIHETRALSDGIDFSQARLDDINDRLDTIKKLEKKYGGSVEAVLNYFEKISTELSELDVNEEDIKLLCDELEEHKKMREKSAKELSESRKRAGEKLSREIEVVLAELDMPKARFGVDIKEGEYTQNGADSVEFVICPNVGEEMKSLAKFASGGELARVMLAMKSILADTDNVDTLIFDEIDTGVSGSASQKIAQKLKALGNKKQVVCVSHQPQLAAIANQHLLIKKSSDGNRTTTSVTELDTKGRISEVARIIDGANPSEAALLHAKVMIENA